MGCFVVDDSFCSSTVILLRTFNGIRTINLDFPVDLLQTT